MLRSKQNLMMTAHATNLQFSIHSNTPLPLQNTLRSVKWTHPIPNSHFSWGSKHLILSNTACMQIILHTRKLPMHLDTTQNRCKYYYTLVLSSWIRISRCHQLQAHTSHKQPSRLQSPTITQQWTHTSVWLQQAYHQFMGAKIDFSNARSVQN